MQLNDAIFLNSSVICAIFINTVLILLILKKSPASLGAYKYLMIYINIFELTYAILYFAEKPIMLTKESAFLIIMNWRESIFPKYAACTLNLLFIGFFGMSVAILALHFIYRYLSITKSNLLKTFDSWKIVPWFMIPLLNGITFMCTAGFLMRADEQTDRFINENYPPLVKNLSTINDLYYVGPLFWPKYANSMTEHFFSWKAARSCLIAMGLIGFSNSIMVFFGLKAYLVMKNLMSQSTSSDKFKSIQQQLLLALILQTSIPVLLMHIPATAIYLTIFMRKSNEIIGETIGLTIAMYPALNPIPTILIVKNYRTVLINILAYAKRRVFRQTAVTPLVLADVTTIAMQNLAPN
ncbi:Serpentine receptor class r-10 [Caenorhabditis elegans]|uniref:Serpentine receptor class r-10 n=1 Tax=Caenorhabditis elegans TaxID=6239 RepID=G5EE51_CAEEL|nr:Seven TM Receptor [Caenorhabditis elegans]NP_503686.1 Seven TM Receptor [Caenorhabditis elegans]CCD62287.1 Seven TM Receptor [Caenorhabditis elegans]CCD64360.1 Seven TM Receptor [Caenorhabditis elegans]|eukprot:NP_503659.2 Uncharacterized protein CELE_Y19D10A.2 [Caenorhabditis elegans]